MNDCVWCTRPVAQPGDTCDAQCYTAWYAWAWAEGDELEIDGKIINLGDVEEPPADLTEQPWYGKMIDPLEGE